MNVRTRTHSTRHADDALRFVVALMFALVAVAALVAWFRGTPLG